MGLITSYLEGQTPLDVEEMEGLLLSSLSTRSELDAFEQANIEDAVLWLEKRNLSAHQILTEEFICLLHKRMYGQVWRWAGKFRSSQKNIGCAAWQIRTQLRSLLDDTQFWLEANTYADDELCLRFKHRLVAIHCFPNGNGRHSRLMADILATQVFKKKFFSWGAGGLVKKSDARSMYIAAVKTADRGDLKPLLKFARL